MGRGPWAVLCQRLPASLPLAALRPDACLDISLRTLQGLELDALTERLRFNRVGLRARTYHAGCLGAQPQLASAHWLSQASKLSLHQMLLVLLET